VNSSTSTSGEPKIAYLYVSQGIDTPNILNLSQDTHSDPTHGKTTMPITADQSNKIARGYSYEIWLDNTPSDKGVS
jgi:hypothetical protein